MKSTSCCLAFIEPATQGSIIYFSHAQEKRNNGLVSANSVFTRLNVQQTIEFESKTVRIALKDMRTSDPFTRLHIHGEMGYLNIFMKHQISFMITIIKALRSYGLIAGIITGLSKIVKTFCFFTRRSTASIDALTDFFLYQSSLALIRSNELIPATISDLHRERALSTNQLVSWMTALHNALQAIIQ